jgi:acetate kinase
MTCESLNWLGITLDDAANRRNEKRISASGSRVAVMVIPTDEEAMIARQVVTLLGPG